MPASRALARMTTAMLSLALGASAWADETRPRVEHVVVYAEPGRFAGWPANHGIWAWGDEILVGFSRGYYKDRGPYHHIAKEKPEEHVLARSRDGGLTWSVEIPGPPGALVGTRGMRHGLVPPGPAEPPLEPLKRPITFTHPDFCITLRMENKDRGTTRLSYSYDRGHTWLGPYRFPLLGQPGVMGRTDYLVEGRDDCLVVLTASKSDGTEGRPISARTTDGGLTWSFLGHVGPEPRGYAIMPSTVRVSPTDLVTTIRRLDPGASVIDAYASHDNGRSWSFLSTPEPAMGEGNPPSLLRLPDGRLSLIYGYRSRPFGIRARLSDDQGKTWSSPIILRDDGGSRDLGYVRSVVRTDGRVVAVYYYNDRAGPARYLAATIWEPGRH